MAMQKCLLIFTIALCVRIQKHYALIKSIIVDTCDILNFIIKTSSTTLASVQSVGC